MPSWCSNFNSVPEAPRNLLPSYLTGWRHKPPTKSRIGSLNQTPYTAQYPLHCDQAGYSNKVSETSRETRLWGSIADTVSAVAPSLQRFGKFEARDPASRGQHLTAILASLNQALGMSPAVSGKEFQTSTGAHLFQSAAFFGPRVLPLVNPKLRCLRYAEHSANFSSYSTSNSCLLEIISTALRTHLRSKKFTRALRGFLQ
jgi:hypothetical protein